MTGLVLPDAVADPAGRDIEEIRADLESARLRQDSAAYARARAELAAYHDGVIERCRTKDPVLRARRVAEGRAKVAAMVDEWAAARAYLGEQ